MCASVPPRACGGGTHGARRARHDEDVARGRLQQLANAVPECPNAERGTRPRGASGSTRRCAAMLLVALRAQCAAGAMCCSATACITRRAARVPRGEADDERQDRQVRRQVLAAYRVPASAMRYTALLLAQSSGCALSAAAYNTFCPFVPT
jgi:hypothetical protein